MSINPFKVVIVGGGPVGLTAAHSLSQAGLDFVVLESRAQIVQDAGSNLVLLPIGLRVLSQLGMLSKIESVSSPMDRFKRIDHKGRDLGDTMFFTYFKEKYVNWASGYVPDLTDISSTAREHTLASSAVMI
jgi:2-polyprenyl-6-methoxyphenol hydroxylase-like FAD-dependent oxidoreductase